MRTTRVRVVLAVALVVLLVGAIAVVTHIADTARRVHVTAYFDNTTGIYPGDQVRILGIPVGEIETITPSPSRATVTFWVDRKYSVPADVQAVILSPAVVSARVIQLTPAYTGGPLMTDGGVIPQSRTAVPVEWDELRQQLAKLTESLQPATPGGVAPAGALINTAADNLRGQGANIRDAIAALSQALSALGDHSTDIFSTVKNVSILVTALQSSGDVLASLNQNFAAVTGLLANDPGEVGHAVEDLNSAVREVQGFIADNREPLGISLDKLASTTQSVVSSLGDIKQVLHVAPNSLANFTNVYYPATASLTGANVFPHFANPLQFICSAVEAASRLNYEQSAKLCAQYLAPIFKNRQYNFPPLGTTIGPFTSLPLPLPVVGAKARPNEITYSEDWMRPDYRPTPTPGADAAGADSAPPGSSGSALPAEAPVQTDPAAGLPGLMVPPGGGS